jgi:hypothetical protein
MVENQELLQSLDIQLSDRSLHAAAAA